MKITNQESKDSDSQAHMGQAEPGQLWSVPGYSVYNMVSLNCKKFYGVVVYTSLTHLYHKISFFFSLYYFDDEKEVTYIKVSCYIFMFINIHVSSLFKVYSGCFFIEF